MAAADNGGDMEVAEERSPAMTDSSEGEEGDEEQEDLGGRSFLNILSVLAGRNSLGLASSGLARVVQGGSTSDSDESDQDFWQPYRPKLCPAKPQPPDTAELDQSELRLETCSDLALHTPRAPLSLPRLLHHRELGSRFSGRDRRRLGGMMLPHNPRQVAAFKNKVFCGTYARGGDIFMSACQDRKIRIYDTSQMGFKLVQTIEAQDVGWSVLDVALSPDGGHLVYSSWSDSLHQVNILDKEDRQVSLPINPDGRQFCIFSVSFSQDSQELLCGANDGFIYLYDRFSHRQSLRVSAHEDDVNAVCFLDDTTFTVASGGDDGLCKVWDRRALREDNPKPVGVLAGHVDGIAFLDPKGDGRHLISNSKDQTIKLWDIRKFSSSSAIRQGRREVSRQRWDYRWERVPRSVAGCSRRVEGDSSVVTYTGHTVLQTLVRARFSPKFTTGQRYIYTGCAAGRVVIYDLLTGQIVKELAGHQGVVRDVSWHPYRQEIISSSWDFSVLRWDGVEAPVEEDEAKGGNEDQEEGREGRKDKKKKKLSRKSSGDWAARE